MTTASTPDLPTAARGRRGTGPRLLGRRLAVTLAFLLAMAGTAVGVGALGGAPIDEAAGGLRHPLSGTGR
jgi:hypothetical protein